MRSEGARRLVEEALREGYSLSMDALRLLETAEDPLEALRTTLRHLREKEPAALVIEARHVKEAGAAARRLTESASEIVLEEPEPEEEGWSPSIEVDERFLKRYRILGRIEEFQRYFQSRYEKLRGILERRGEAFSRASDALRLQKNGETVLALMLTEKRETERAIILTAEDPSASIKIIVPKRSQELAQRAGRLLPDQVFGVRVRRLDGALMAQEIMLPDVPSKARPPPQPGPDIYLLLVSDLHVGSKRFRQDLWESLLDWLHRGRDGEAKRIRYMVIAGDLVDGIGVFPGQERELEHTSVTAQLEEAARMLSEIPGHVKLILSPGNHDPVERALPQPPLPEKYLKPLRRAREFTAVGNPAWIMVEGRSFLVYHGQSLDDLIQALPNASYSTLSQDMGKVLETILQSRHLAPIYGESTPLLPVREDLLVLDRVPDVLHTGHVHVAYAGTYREVRIINTGTWQEQTSYQKGMGLEPTVGTAAVVNLRTLTVKLKKFT